MVDGQVIALIVWRRRTARPGHSSMDCPDLQRATKKPEPLIWRGIPAFRGPLRTRYWWRWAELNRRPKALHPQHYMLSSPLNLIPEQHGVQSAPGNQPVVF